MKPDFSSSGFSALKIPVKYLSIVLSVNREIFNLEALQVTVRVRLQDVAAKIYVFSIYVDGISVIRCNSICRYQKGGGDGGEREGERDGDVEEDGMGWRE